MRRTAAGDHTKPDSSTMLHVTNGDHAAAAIRKTGIAGLILPWRDVLHEGPVPADLSLADLRSVRARFIADQGWGPFESVLRDFEQRDAALEAWSDHDEVVLWFEHDLYDQLQLLQVLDYFATLGERPETVTLICVDEFFGQATATRLVGLFEERRAVSPSELDLGRRAWTAFRSPDPGNIGELLERGTAALPFLRGALVRHLEQYPSTTNGLSRTERQGLEALAAGAANLREAFLASQEREERRFLGDTMFAHHMSRLSPGVDPAVTFADGTPLVAQEFKRDGPSWSRGTVVTEAGKAVLQNQRDWIGLHGIDRWLGGVHLIGGVATWRWDPQATRLQKAL